MKKPLGMESIIIFMNFPLSLPLFVGRYLLQSLEGICEALRLWYSINWTPTLCLVLWWSAGKVKMETTEPAVIFPVAAQCIQMCFLPRAKVQRFGLSLGCIHAILQVVCLWREDAFGAKETAWLCQLCEREGREKLLPCSLHSDFRACCDSCMLEYWSLCC